MLRRTLTVMSWRDHGITYVKYLNVCTEALHMATKDKIKAKYDRYSTPNYVTIRPDGQGSFEEVKRVPASSKDF